MTLALFYFFSILPISFLLIFSSLPILLFVYTNFYNQTPSSIIKLACSAPRLVGRQRGFDLSQNYKTLTSFAAVALGPS